MTKKKISEPYEVPVPEKNPEINPTIRPEEPIVPGEDPEINPDKPPGDPSVPEIPVPPQKNHSNKM